MPIVSADFILQGLKPAIYAVLDGTTEVVP